MDIEVYMEKLLSQIRCKKARPFIEKEIRGHIESQIEDYISEGMSPDEAGKNAVTDMGDPVSVGISLDKVHRPQMDWRLLAAVGILSILGVLLQLSFNVNLARLEGEASGVAGGIIYYGTWNSYLASVILGLLCMFTIYFVDYTVIARYAKIIGACMIILGGYSLVSGTPMRGMRYYIRLAGIEFNFAAFMTLYVPVYGAILYSYRDGGIGAFVKSIIWLIIPAGIAFGIPNLMAGYVLLLSMLLQLSVAVYKRWFRLRVRPALITVWSLFFAIPLVGLGGMYLLHMLDGYQEARIRVWLSLSGESCYTLDTVRRFAKNIQLFGAGDSNIIGSLPDLNRDYVFSYILNTYGSIAGILAILILAALNISVFSAIIKQKNELGLSIGCGCGMILSINSFLNILCSIGILPPSASFCPFFSAGGSNMILSYALIGIVLSIYRYKDVYPGRVSVSGKRRLRLIRKNVSEVNE